jgi:hypothetical protein
MTRADLLAHAAGVLSELAAEAGVVLADDPAGIAGQLNAAERDLGDDTGNSAAGEALIEYHVLRRLRYAVASRVDFDATAMQRGRSQIYNQVSALLDDAANRAAAAGHPVVATPAAPVGPRLIGLNLDYLDSPAEYDA